MRTKTLGEGRPRSRVTAGRPGRVCAGGAGAARASPAWRACPRTSRGCTRTRTATASSTARGKTALDLREGSMHGMLHS